MAPCFPCARSSNTYSDTLSSVGSHSAVRFNWVTIIVTIENGFLANRIEGLVLHQKNTVENLGMLYTQWCIFSIRNLILTSVLTMHTVRKFLTCFLFQKGVSNSWKLTVKLPKDRLNDYGRVTRVRLECVNKYSINAEWS